MQTHLNQRQASRKSAFSLVEMLVVIAIIGILVGIVIKVQSLIGERTAKAQTVRRLENIKMCLEEYYRAYGRYPAQSSDPINHGTEYESFSDAGSFPVDWDLIKDSLPQSAYVGLVRHIGAGNYSFADKEHSAKWAEYFNSDVGFDWWYKENVGVISGSGWGAVSFTNAIYWLEDGWERQFVYQCDTNGRQQSFDLYSKGPDGAAGTVDDIGSRGFAE